MLSKCLERRKRKKGMREGGRGKVINLTERNILQILFSNHFVEGFLISLLVCLIIVLIYQYLTLAKTSIVGRQNFKKKLGRKHLKEKIPSSSANEKICFCRLRLTSVPSRPKLSVLEAKLANQTPE